MTAASFMRLLERLHPDAERAAAEYEHLRRALVRFFDWRGVWPPDECADEALDRLTRRVEEETAVSDLRSYAYGIARLILLERRRAPRFTAMEDVPELANREAPSPAGDDPQQLCFERCLDGFEAGGRSVLLRYYDGERQVKIANRRRLAASLGISDNALRSRVQRLRERLEQCIQACTAARGEGAL